MEEREKYAAVFNDQYREYKDLHRDVISTLSRFRELDLMMSQLLRNGKNPQVRWSRTKLLAKRVKVSTADLGWERSPRIRC